MNSVPEQKPPYLFYSPKCANSGQLIELLKKNQQLFKAVVPVNIHTTKNLPQGLTGVPAILFRSQLIVGGDAFKWVQMQTPQQEQKPVQMGQQGQQGQQGLPELDVLDICGSNTACYAMLEEEAKKGTRPVSKIDKYSELENQGDSGVDMSKAMENTENNKRSNGMAQDYERLQKERDVGQSGPGGNFSYQ